MSDTHRIGSGALTAEIAARGAELVSLKGADGEELIWQAGPEWPRHAPNLFPIVGRLANDTLRSGDKAYRLTQHGFARDRVFAWTERSGTRAALTLADDAETRAVYPFAFRLDFACEVEGATLTLRATVTNTDTSATLPFAIGAHPGFRWPLVDGVAKTDHALEFEPRETGPSRPVVGGLLGPDQPLPFDGKTLPLREGLFAADALVMPSVANRSVRYVARGLDGAALKMLVIAWEAYDDLGVWSKPDGAPFLCVEPWRGMASPVGWDGDFADKPGLSKLAPGASASFAWSVTTA